MAIDGDCHPAVITRWEKSCDGIASLEEAVPPYSQAKHGTTQGDRIFQRGTRHVLDTICDPGSLEPLTDGRDQIWGWFHIAPVTVRSECLAGRAGPYEIKALQGKGKSVCLVELEGVPFLPGQVHTRDLKTSKVQPHACTASSAKEIQGLHGRRPARPCLWIHCRYILRTGNIPLVGFSMVPDLQSSQ